MKRAQRVDEGYKLRWRLAPARCIRRRDMDASVVMKNYIYNAARWE
jgi:hypothetical protein